MALCGAPDSIQSDNDSYFVGANMKLNILSKVLQSDAAQDAIHHWCALKNIQWSFMKHVEHHTLVDCGSQEHRGCSLCTKWPGVRG